MPCFPGINHVVFVCYTSYIFITEMVRFHWNYESSLGLDQPCMQAYSVRHPKYPIIRFVENAVYFKVLKIIKLH